MLLKHKKLAAVLSMSSQMAFAQEKPVFSVSYENLSGGTVEAQDAIYKVKRTETAGQHRLDSVFYANSGYLRFVRSTTWLPTGDTVTAITRWRQNGALQNRSQISRNGLRREFLDLTPAGQTIRRTVLETGKSSVTECFSESGALIGCATLQVPEKMPEFPGGSQAMLAHIARSIRYPKEALKKRQQGRVLVKFVLDETGQARAVHVKQGISPALDAEAERVIRSLPRFKPGQQDGEAVPVFFTVPVSFTIN